MKVETTIVIEADLLQQFEDAAKDLQNRSEIYEKALQDYLPKLKRRTKIKLTREEETEILNRMAIEERDEILENLEYQIDL